MKKIGSVGTIKIYRDTEWDEYICKTPTGETYHTDNKKDAENTASIMHLEHIKLNKQGLIKVT